jgi:hypothetical protein
MFFSSKPQLYIHYGMFEGIAFETGTMLFSAGMIYLTHVYAKYAVHRIYESSDKKRIGFQVHNIFGSPGRVFEIPLGNIKIVDYTGTGPVALEISGFGKHFVVSDREQFYKNKYLIDLISKSALNCIDESKAQRTEWYKTAARKKKDNNK